ncbi:MAG: asparagine synthase (glutamine-hydrolyzing) [Nitrospira sp.]|nr:MAG: asparagine synthase (glutamine-hydrolyzing) [Nitrospira sp.]
MAYRIWGTESVSRLRGMFAFAIWDPSQEKLLLVRDRIGKKPLFYYHDARRFAFASELKALLALPGIEKHVNLAALHDYLTFGYVPGEQTIVNAIRKVPPGHFLVWHDGKIFLERYWNLDDWFQGSSNLVMSDQEWSDETRDRLADCVQARLVSDVPVGAFLSGGIDSSAVVGFMARELGRGVKTFSIGFRESSFNELDYARVVAKHFDTDHHEFVVEPRAADLLADLVWYLDEPFADASVLPTYLLARLAREHVKVVLTGDGGDESFAGYESYLAEQYTDLYGRTPLALRCLIESVLARAPESSKRTAVLRRAKRFVEKAALPLEYREWRLIFSHAAKQALYGDELNSAIGSVDSLERRARAFRAARDFDWVTALQLWDFHVYLSDDLMVKTDRATMANGLEARSPFLDHTLIEWCAGMPSSLKVRGWNTKYILKKSLQSMLPTEIIHRPKQGFAVPVSAWFRGALREMAQDLLLSTTCIGRGYFRQGSIEALLRAHVRGEADHAYKLWSLVNLELWHQSFLDCTQRALPLVQTSQDRL